MRLILFMVGAVCIAVGAHGLWFEDPVGERGPVGSIAEALGRLAKGEDPVPLRLERAPAEVTPLAPTGLERPPFATCDADVDNPAAQRPGCPAAIPAQREPVTLRLEARIDGAADEACDAVAFRPVAGSARRIWAFVPVPLPTPAPGCAAAVRARFPWSFPRERTLHAQVLEGDAPTAPEAARATRGRVSRGADLVENLAWLQVRDDADAQASLDAALSGLLPEGRSGDDTRFVLPELLSASTARPPSYLPIDDLGAAWVALPLPAGLSFPAQGTLSTPAPWTHRALRASLDPAPPVLAVWKPGSVEHAEEERVELAWFALALGLALWGVALIAHLVVRRR